MLFIHTVLRKRFEQQPQDVAAQIGQSIQLTCRPPLGVPTPIVSWEKDGRALDLSDPRYTLLENGDLVISDVRVTDAGDYQCAATNNAHTRSSRSGTVTVG